MENLFLKLVFKPGYPFKGRIGRALTAKSPKGGDIYQIVDQTSPHLLGLPPLPHSP